MVICSSLQLQIHEELIVLEDELEQAIRTECTKYIARVIGIITEELKAQE